MGRFALVATLVVAGLSLIVAGVAFIFWPAALVVGGAGILSCAFLIDLPDALPQGEQVNIVDETSEEPVATIARVRG